MKDALPNKPGVFTLDGLTTGPTWTAKSGQVDAYLGAAVSTAGDMDGGGYAELSAVVENYQPGQPADAQTNVRTEYTRDAAGQLLSVVNARGYTATHTTYDALGRPVAVEDALGNRTYTRYDALGNRVVVTDANGAVTAYGYDGLNQPVSIQSPDSGVQYAYDAAGRRVVMTDSLGVTAYVYDELNRLVTVADPITGTVSYG